MPIKDILQRFQPIPLYVVLVISICYFSVQLVLSHITHALTLLMSSYHMLCNILALAGCIFTIKHSSKRQSGRDDHHHTYRSSIIQCSENGSNSNDDRVVVVSMGEEEQTLAKREIREQKLLNTFGWARIDILTMLIVFIILASLSFSLIVEALQTLVHIDHQDTMHLPIPVMILGCAGLVLNGLTYLLIGGYTLHQGSFLHLTPGGNVVLDRSMSNSGDLSLKPIQRQLSKSRNDQQLREELEADVGTVYFATKRQGAVEMLRDVSSTVFVILCAAIVYVAEDEEHTAKFIDPILSIFSCVLLVSLSYPYMKESCLILLQTIPGSIDMEIFERTLVSKFPEIVSYHDLHIWQLAAHSYVATIHIKFQNPKLYSKIIEDVRTYFHEQGIGAVTIQPEFHTTKTPSASLECLMQCSAPECVEKVCCRDSRSDLREISLSPSGSDDSSHHAANYETPHSRSLAGTPSHSGCAKPMAAISTPTLSSSSHQQEDNQLKELNAAQLLTAANKPKTVVSVEATAHTTSAETQPTAVVENAEQPPHEPATTTTAQEVQKSSPSLHVEATETSQSTTDSPAIEQTDDDANK